MRRMVQNSFFSFFFQWFFFSSFDFIEVRQIWNHRSRIALQKLVSIEVEATMLGCMHFQWCQWGEICFCQSNSNSQDCQLAPGTGAPVLWFSQSLWVSDSPVYRCFSGWMRTVHLRNLPNVKRESQTRTSCYGRKS